jgi:head-tail adaptor
MSIGPRTTIADRPHLVYLEKPTRMKDREGGYRETWIELNPPTLFVSIAPSSGGSQQLSDGSMVSTVTHAITGPYHPELTTECRLRFEDQGRTRVFRVTGGISPDERRQENVLQCAETTT